VVKHEWCLSINPMQGSISSCNANKKQTYWFEKEIKAVNLESRLIPTREAVPCISWFKLCYSHVFLLSIELIHTINKKFHSEYVA